MIDDRSSARSVPARRMLAIIQVMVFLTIIAIILAANWRILHLTNNEVGDFAANSLLIQKAKGFSLFTGNYSRIGFNHPGPAILYVLAFGELLFHDWLHLVKSPFSGQLIAAALYNGFWASLFFRILVDLTSAIRLALVGTFAFILLAASSNIGFLTGIWFPELYFFPFAVLTVAVARVAVGNGRSLVSLALAAGFLINGHVSFIAMIAVVVVVTSALNLVLTRAGTDGSRILSFTFFRANGRASAIAVGIVFIFLMPLMLQTALHYPGPIADYIAFSGGQQPHALLPALLFVKSYWESSLTALALLLTLLFLCNERAGNSSLQRTLRGFSTAIVATTAALTIYAIYGIDDLSLPYIGFFYYAVPAVLIVTLGMRCLDSLRPDIAGSIGLISCVVCLYKTLNLVSAPLGYADQFNDPSLENLYRAVKAKVDRGILVFDIENEVPAGARMNWLEIAGLQAYAARRHERLFCIRKNWHVLFTPEAKCSVTELRTENRYTVRNTAMPVPDGQVPAFVVSDLAFYKYTVPDITRLGYIPVAGNAAAFNYYYFDSGWSAAESAFAWSEGKQAFISVRIDPAATGKLELDLGAFLPSAKTVQQVYASVDGDEPVTVTLSGDKPRQLLSVPIVATPASGVVDIRLDIAHPMSPKQSGVGEDRRLLGVSLYGMQFVRAGVKP